MKKDIPSGSELSQSKIESNAINYAAAAGIISFLVSLIIFHSQSVSLFGGVSIGLVASILSSIAAVIIFFTIYYRFHRQVGDRQSLYGRVHSILTALALAFVHAAVCFLLLVSAFFLLQDGFKELYLDSLTSSGMVALMASMSSYVIYLASISTTTVRMSSLLALFLVSGALTSMITAEDPLWWERHFSALGAGSSLSSFTFNITLIIGGIVITSLADYIANDFKKLQASGEKYLKVKAGAIRAILVLIGVFLALVGLFAYDNHPLLHNSAAGGMAVVFVILILALPYFVPTFSRSFFILSYLLMASLIFCYWLMNGIGYLNLTAFELIAAGIIFGWLVVFVRQIAAGLLDDTSIHNDKVTAGE